MQDRRLTELRRICADLPGCSEGITVHHPSFTIRGKAFVMVTDGHGDPALWVKSDRGTQAELIAADPEHFFAPPSVGHHGWVGVRTGEGTDWAEVAEIVVDGYRLAAPKRLLAEYDARRG